MIVVSGHLEQNTRCSMDCTGMPLSLATTHSSYLWVDTMELSQVFWLSFIVNFVELSVRCSIQDRILTLELCRFKLYKIIMKHCYVHAGLFTAVQFGIF